MSFVSGREHAQRNAETDRKTEGQYPQRHRHRKTLSNDVVDSVIAVFHGWAEIPGDQAAVHAAPCSFRAPLPKEPEIAQILIPDRLIQVIFGFQSALDF